MRYVHRLKYYSIDLLTVGLTSIHVYRMNSPIIKSGKVTQPAVFF
jgi:hypothetical protein